jgi:hypothetical protein
MSFLTGHLNVEIRRASLCALIFLGLGGRALKAVPTDTPSPTPAATCVSADAGYSVSGAPVDPSGLVTFQSINVASATQATALEVDVQSTGGGRLKMALYADDGTGNPGALLAQTADLESAVGVVNGAFAPVAIGPGTYYIALQSDPGVLVQHVSPGPVNLTYLTQAWGPFPQPPTGLSPVPYTQSARLLTCGSGPTATPSATPSPTPLACGGASYGYTTSGSPVDVFTYMTWQGLSLTSAVDGVGIEVDCSASIGGALQMALYGDNGSGLPGSLLAQTGWVSSHVGTVGGSISAPGLAPGLYFLALQVQTHTQIQHSSPGPYDLLIQTVPWGSFPDPAVAASTVPYTQSIRLIACPALSPTPTFSATSTASPSQTPTPTLTRTRTSSPTPSATPTRTPPPTATVTPSATPSASPTPSATASVTRTATPPNTLTCTVTPTISPTPTATPLIPDRDVSVIKVTGFPNPNPRSLRVRLDGNGAALKLRCYSPSYVLMLQWDAGAMPEGWNDLPLPAAAGGLPNGICFLTVSVEDAVGHWSKPARGTIYLAR